MGDEWTVNSEQSKRAFIAHIESEFEKHKYLTVKVKVGKQATDTQLSSMHLFIRHVVAQLNERGITVTEFFKEGFELPWTEQIFKDNCWKPLQRAIMEDNKSKSTKDQTRDIPGKVHEILSRKFEKWGFSVEWPSKKQ